MELFEKIINRFQSLPFSTKSYILDVQQGSEYASDSYN